MFGKDQATTQIFTEDLLYTVGGMAVVMVVGGLVAGVFGRETRGEKFA